MVVYGLALGNQRRLNGGDFSTTSDELWPPAAGLVHAAAIDPLPPATTGGFRAVRQWSGLRSG
jgi:hypothetical protein